MQPITNLATNIITGFLGSGKTTAINHLLAHKPANERWAVLVNEFGQIGVDEAQMEGHDGVQIQELAGGCFCCTLGPALSTTLATLIRRARPDRLLIEPTGLGHPTGIIDTLTAPPFAGVIELQAMICLIDPRNLSQPEIASQPVFRDQIQLADVLVLNKADQATPEQLAAMVQQAEQLYPPKQAVITTEQAQVPLTLLDYQPTSLHSAQTPDAHHHHHHAHPAAPAAPEPGQPVRLEGSDGEFVSCGWLYHASQQFDPTALFTLIEQWPDLLRAKGVFRAGDMSISINRVGSDCHSQPVTYRRDSRLELISKASQDWDAFEQALQNCLR